jgi:hypothetical protein
LQSVIDIINRQEKSSVTKQKRAKLHAAINALTRKEVAEIIKKAHPRVNGVRLDQLAKEAIAQAHRIVSPRK